ncbi:hypothetical protein TWF217_008598 [Orbilia oligospora]|nr:hypothetical protein TWF751_003306 [Orbilia oligospora]KAF3250561.1 hypothetical protein TWF217_008598 [Orbilia oligospora]
MSTVACTPDKTLFQLRSIKMRGNISNRPIQAERHRRAPISCVDGKLEASPSMEEALHVKVKNKPEIRSLTHTAEPRLTPTKWSVYRLLLATFDAAVRESRNACQVRRL